MVNGIEIVKVVGAIRQFRRVDTIDEIVVRRE